MSDSSMQLYTYIALMLGQETGSEPDPYSSQILGLYFLQRSIAGLQRQVQFHALSLLFIFLPVTMTTVPSLS